VITRELLGQATGVIHVGANEGQERYIYASYDIPVLWIEPINHIYQNLLQNIAQFPRQRALPYLIGAETGFVRLHLASNNGESSSIFPLGLHRHAFPEIRYENDMWVYSRTLDSLDIQGHDVLVLDVQGAELLALKGAPETLQRMRWVQVEAYENALYEGGACLADIQQFMEAAGFREAENCSFDLRNGCGKGYEVVYEKMLTASNGKA
jgi:FkbM family methyltransferase